ncbi:MAG TPA: formyltransferase family protein [Opitutaceae bacterium]|nr:formyltransferase family protein [Opitutaceae bacterium]
MKLRLAFYVSGNAGRLRKLLAEDNRAILDDVRLVFSDDPRNADLVEPLQRRGCACVCVDYRALGPDGAARSLALSEAMLAEFQRHGIDYGFCFGAHILRGRLLDVYRYRIINFHPSLLPQFPGLNAIDQAVTAKAFLLGNTAHFITEQIDGGPIIMQSVTTRGRYDKLGYDGVLDLQLPMVCEILAWLKAGGAWPPESSAPMEGDPVAFFRNEQLRLS